MSPDFLCIGAQKAGTKWLYDQLQNHPDVYLPPVKEIHYWDVYYEMHKKGEIGLLDKIVSRKWKRHLGKVLNREQPIDFRWHSHFFLGKYDLDWYRSLFDKGGEKIKGEITPEYCILKPEVVREVYDMNPGLKLIYLLRNPVDRAWSSFRMYVRRKKLNFNQMSEEQVKEFLNSSDVLTKGDYVSSIKNWTAIFPKEQLFIGYLEEMKNDPSQLLDRICQHIGADFSRLKADHSINEPSHEGQSIPLSEKYRKYMKSRYFQHNQELYEMTGNEIVKGWNS